MAVYKFTKQSVCQVTYEATIELDLDDMIHWLEDVNEPIPENATPDDIAKLFAQVTDDDRFDWQFDEADEVESDYMHSYPTEMEKV